LSEVLGQFAPAINPQPMESRTRDSAKNSRWACPLRGHDDHTLQSCPRFWVMKTNRERRERIRGAACFCCLGKNQGCARGICANLSEIPVELVCKECATLHSRSPNNVLVCTAESHRKPSGQSIAGLIRRWIPGVAVPLPSVYPTTAVFRTHPACEQAKSLTDQHPVPRAELFQRRATRCDGESNVENLFGKVSAVEESAKVIVEEVIVQPVRMAAAVIDTAGSNLSGYCARATFPCWCRRETRRESELYVAHRPDRGRSDPDSAQTQ
jgi:hypothetical protein